MKTLVKLLIAAALLGGVLIAVGVWNGGQLYTGYENGVLRPLFGFHGTYDSGAEHGTGKVLDPESIDTLRIEVSGGSCEIEMENEFSCSSEVDMTVDGSTVTLSVDNGDAEIILPEYRFDLITVDISGGALEADRLNARETFLNVSGGSVTIDQIWSNSAIIDGSMGRIDIDDLNTRDSRLSISAGEVIIENLYVDDLMAECTGGRIGIGFPRDPADYRCTADISAGACTWNGGALEDAGFGSTDAENTIDLTVTAGAIELYAAKRD